jgi:hypothetical protein
MESGCEFFQCLARSAVKDSVVAPLTGKLFAVEIGSDGANQINNQPQESRSLQRLKSLTLADLGAAGGPVGESMRNGVTLTLLGVYVAGPTALGAHANNLFVSVSGAGQSVFGGTVSGGQLTKWSQGYLLLADPNNSYSGGSVVNGDAAAGSTSLLGSLTRTGAPFGTGPITVNPGAMLRIADPSNISGNAVTILSDGAGLGGLALGGNFAPPTILIASHPQSLRRA